MADSPTALRCKLDENVPVDAAPVLRAAGYGCRTVYDERLAGAPDPDVAAACRAEGRVLVTLDLDIGCVRPAGQAAAGCPGRGRLRSFDAPVASFLFALTRRRRPCRVPRDELLAGGDLAAAVLNRGAGVRDVLAGRLDRS